MIKFIESGGFTNLERYLKKSVSVSSDIRRIMERYGREGVQALSSSTPSKTGATARSWDFQVDVGKDKSTITWTNSNTPSGGKVPVVILIQYGHMTRNGGYVQGVDFINPALRSVFKEFANDIYREVIL